MHFRIMVLSLTRGKRGFACNACRFDCCRIKIIAGLAANIAARGAATTSANLVVQLNTRCVTVFRKDT